MGYLGGVIQGVASEIDSTSERDTGKSRKHGPLHKLLHRKKQQKTTSGDASSSEGTNPGSGTMPSLKRGGRVKRTGPHFLHRGEIVLNAKQAKRHQKQRRKKA